jgi:hypothetical protein
VRRLLLDIADLAAWAAVGAFGGMLVVFGMSVVVVALGGLRP